MASVSQKWISAATINATSVKPGPTLVIGIQVFNFATSLRYLKIYDLGAVPSPSGGSVPNKTIPIPPASASGQVGGYTSGANPIILQTGLAFCITGGLADNDTTAIGASDVVLNLDYN